MIIFNILTTIFGLHQIFFWLYWFQVKEYRLDRFLSSLKEDWRWLVVEQWNLRRWFRPKLTLRSGLTLLLAVAPIPLEFALLENKFLLFLVFAPFQAVLANIFFAPVFGWLKKRIITQAKRKMAQFKGVVVVITGSFGKSSTKELLSWVLSKKFKVVKTAQNHNTLIGVAETILRDLSGDEDFFVVEAGAYKRGEIAEVCALVKPGVGIITGIGDQHLDLFGSLENIRKAKYELFEAIPKYGLKLLAGKDYRVSDLKSLKQNKEFLEFYLGTKKCRVPVLGKALALNIAGAVKAARLLGLSVDEIANALNQFPEGIFYPKLTKISKDIYLVDDNYSASLESFLSVLDYLKVYQGFKKIVVTPGIIELGEKSRQDHLMVGKALVFVDKIIVTRANRFKELNRDGKAVLIKDFQKIIQVIKEELKQKTVVLFKGRMPLGLIDAVVEIREKI